MSSNSRSRPAVSHMPSMESREVEKDQILDIVKLDSQNVLIVGHTALYSMGVAAKFQRIQKIYCYEDNFNGLNYDMSQPPRQVKYYPSLRIAAAAFKSKLVLFNHEAD